MRNKGYVSDKQRSRRRRHKQAKRLRKAQELLRYYQTRVKDQYSLITYIPMCKISWSIGHHAGRLFQMREEAAKVLDTL